MSDNQTFKGNCIFCDQSYSKSDMTRHLKSCTERVKRISLLNSKSNDNIGLFHLLVQDAWSGEFWLHLETSGDASLKVLDKYLRAVWLECCGHQSQFSYEKWKHKIPMNSLVKSVFEPGNEIYHIYDFGNSSENKIKVIEKRDGITLSQKPIFLMARNDAPEYMCKECGAKAKWLCLECMYENDDDTFCDKHIESHPHDQYGEPLEIVNSPRLGMCGYEGPADPPY